jgi:hypothetical protein
MGNLWLDRAERYAQTQKHRYNTDCSKKGNHCQRQRQNLGVTSRRVREREMGKIGRT